VTYSEISFPFLSFGRKGATKPIEPEDIERRSKKVILQQPRCDATNDENEARREATMVSASENVPAAFGLVCMAGLSTAIGSAVVFFPALVSVVNRKTLAMSLALSAGVMTYSEYL
jgi:hypothetical protein